MVTLAAAAVVAAAVLARWPRVGLPALCGLGAAAMALAVWLGQRR